MTRNLSGVRGVSGGMKSLLAVVAALALLLPAPVRAAEPTVGAGWYLATVEQSHPQRLRLELVAPDGATTQVLDIRQRG